MVWPSYWAFRKEGKLHPALPEEIGRSLQLPVQTPEEVQRDPYNTKPLSDGQIQTALQSLPSAKGEPVFIAAGKLFHLQAGKLLAEEDPAARPYAWAFAHDVRPARQALGANGCADCHATDSPIYFATVLARGPIAAEEGLAMGTWQLRGVDKTWAKAFSFTFLFRPWLKGFLFACALVVLAVVAHYALRGVGAITAAWAKKPER
jgi:hypothetical protein